MKIQRYGLELETMQEVHLEMVRLWRNQHYILSRMQFQKVLSSEDQLKWFQNLDPEFNLYWVIRNADYPIGLVHIKNMNGQTGEAGVFIGEPSFLETAQPMLAILMMMELAFYVVGLKQLRAKIHHENFKAIRFNKDLGYQLEPNQKEGFQYYSVTFEKFEIATKGLRLNAARMFGSKTGIGVRPDSVWAKRFTHQNTEATNYLKPFAISY
ncbi:MAG: GNAT family N-acetyltransferase [Flavobacteriales bacterium]|nr:GNAT family N-acetyltransferase [Flavobacteriales bacterium]